jgi:hypothetical protein
MTRRELIDVVERTHAYVTDPNQSDRDTRFMAQAQLAIIGHELKRGLTTIPVGQIGRYLQRKLAAEKAKTNP